MRCRRCLGQDALRSALAGGGAGGLLLGGLAAARRSHENDRVVNAMRFVPPGGTLGDLRTVKEDAEKHANLNTTIYKSAADWRAQYNPNYPAAVTAGSGAAPSWWPSQAQAPQMPAHVRGSGQMTETP